MEDLLQQILEEQRKTNAHLEAFAAALSGLAGMAAMLGLPTGAPEDGDDTVAALPSSGGFFGGN